MTAFAVITTPECGYMASDSIAYDRDGEIHGLASKVLTVPHAASAIGIRGLLEQWQWGTELLSRFATFDQIENEGIALLREQFPEMEWGPDPMDVVVMGLSLSRNSIRAFYSRSPEFAIETGEVILAPFLSPEEQEAAGICLTQYPALDLLRMIKAQAASCAGMVSNGFVHRVGGPVVLTMITAKNIDQRGLGVLPIT